MTITMSSLSSMAVITTPQSSLSESISLEKIKLNNNNNNKRFSQLSSIGNTDHIQSDFLTHPSEFNYLNSSRYSISSNDNKANADNTNRPDSVIQDDPTPNDSLPFPSQYVYNNLQFQLPSIAASPIISNLDCETSSIASNLNSENFLYFHQQFYSSDAECSTTASTATVPLTDSLQIAEDSLDCITASPSSPIIADSTQSVQRYENDKVVEETILHQNNMNTNKQDTVIGDNVITSQDSVSFTNLNNMPDSLENFLNSVIRKRRPSITNHHGNLNPSCNGSPPVRRRIDPEGHGIVPPLLNSSCISPVGNNFIYSSTSFFPYNCNTILPDNYINTSGIHYNTRHKVYSKNKSRSPLRLLDNIQQIGEQEPCSTFIQLEDGHKEQNRVDFYRNLNSFTSNCFTNGLHNSNNNMNKKTTTTTTTTNNNHHHHSNYNTNGKNKYCLSAQRKRKSKIHHHALDDADIVTPADFETKHDIVAYVEQKFEGMEESFTFKSATYQTHLKQFLPRPDEKQRRYIERIEAFPRIPTSLAEKRELINLRQVQRGMTPDSRLGDCDGLTIKERLDEMLTSLVNKIMFLLVVKFDTWYIHAPAREQIREQLLEFIWPDLPDLHAFFREHFSLFIDMRIRHFRDSVARYFRDRPRADTKSGMTSAAAAHAAAAEQQNSGCGVISGVQRPSLNTGTEEEFHCEHVLQKSVLNNESLEASRLYSPLSQNLIGNTENNNNFTFLFENTLCNNALFPYTMARHTTSPGPISRYIPFNPTTHITQTNSVTYQQLTDNCSRLIPSIIPETLSPSRPQIVSSGPVSHHRAPMVEAQAKHHDILLSSVVTHEFRQSNIDQMCYKLAPSKLITSDNLIFPSSFSTDQLNRFGRSYSGALLRTPSAPVSTHGDLSTNFFLENGECHQQSTSYDDILISQNSENLDNLQCSNSRSAIYYQALGYSTSEPAEPCHHSDITTRESLPNSCSFITNSQHTDCGFSTISSSIITAENLKNEPMKLEKIKSSSDKSLEFFRTRSDSDLLKTYTDHLPLTSHISRKSNREFQSRVTSGSLQLRSFEPYQENGSTTPSAVETASLKSNFQNNEKSNPSTLVRPMPPLMPMTVVAAAASVSATSPFLFTPLSKSNTDLFPANSSFTQFNETCHTQPWQSPRQDIPFLGGFESILLPISSHHHTSRKIPCHSSFPYCTTSILPSVNQQFSSASIVEYNLENNKQFQDMDSSEKDSHSQACTSARYDLEPFIAPVTVAAMNENYSLCSRLQENLLSDVVERHDSGQHIEANNVLETVPLFS